MVHVFLGEVQVEQVDGSDAHVGNGVRNLLLHRVHGVQAGDNDFGQEDVNGCVHFLGFSDRVFGSGFRVRVFHRGF
jgi:hypothetical protein